MAASTIAVAASAWAADTQELSAKLNPDILSELRTDEDLAGAPNATRGFGYSYSYEWTGKDPFKSKTAVTYERLPEKGFVLERGAYEEGDGYRRDMRTYFAAGGLLTILETGEVTQPGGKKKPSESHLSNYSISGDLYPVAVGNKFSIKTEMTGTTDWELKEECRVKRKLEASSFDARFTGPAFYVDCRVDVTGGEPGTQDYYYIVELDFFLPDFRDSACSDCKDYRLTLN
jgi:hypothetical protein